MKKYKVLIVSYKVIDSWNEPSNSVSVLAYNLFLAFKKKDDIETLYCSIDDELPEVDFVVVVLFTQDKGKIEEIRNKINPRKICSLRESHFKCDFNFCYNPIFKDFKDTQPMVYIKK